MLIDDISIVAAKKEQRERRKEKEVSYRWKMLVLLIDDLEDDIDVVSLLLLLFRVETKRDVVRFTSSDQNALSQRVLVKIVRIKI
jgi:hypothetical protein